MAFISRPLAKMVLGAAFQNQPVLIPMHFHYTWPGEGGERYAASNRKCRLKPITTGALLAASLLNSEHESLKKYRESMAETLDQLRNSGQEVV